MLSFCLSISDVFPAGTEAENTEKPALQTLKKVQTISDFCKTNINNEDCKKCQQNGETKCLYYVSDDEVTEAKNSKR